MKRKYNILIIIILLMAVLQAPLFYYYSFGLFSFFVVIPYVLIGLGLTIWMLVVVENNSYKGAIWRRVSVLVTALIGALSLFFGESIIEDLDWRLRRDSRNEIVNLVLTGKIHSTSNSRIHFLKNYSFPPISNGGNEIVIEGEHGKGLTIEFFINRGFLDHYSAFVYTTNLNKQKELDQRAVREKGNKKLEDNWYRVSY